MPEYFVTEIQLTKNLVDTICRLVELRDCTIYIFNEVKDILSDN